jgi:chromosome segregation ATPase
MPDTDSKFDFDAQAAQQEIERLDRRISDLVQQRKTLAAQTVELRAKKTKLESHLKVEAGRKKRAKGEENKPETAGEIVAPRA